MWLLLMSTWDETNRGPEMARGDLTCSRLETGAYILLHVFPKWAVSRQSSPPISQLRKLGSRELKGLPGSQVRGTARNPLCSRRLRCLGLEQPPPLLRSTKATGWAGQLTDMLHGSSGNRSSSQFPSNIPRRIGKATSGSSRC